MSIYGTFVSKSVYGTELTNWHGFFFKWCFLSNVQNIFPQSSAASLRNIRPGTKRLKYKTWLLPNLHFFGLFSAEISLDFNFTGDCFEKKYFLFWKIKFPLISSAFLYSVNCLNSTSSSTWSIWKLHCRLHKGSYILKIRFPRKNYFLSFHGLCRGWNVKLYLPYFYLRSYFKIRQITKQQTPACSVHHLEEALFPIDSERSYYYCYYYYQGKLKPA